MPVGMGYIWRYSVVKIWNSKDIQKWRSVCASHAGVGGSGRRRPRRRAVAVLAAEPSPWLARPSSSPPSRRRPPGYFLYSISAMILHICHDNAYYCIYLAFKPTLVWNWVNPSSSSKFLHSIYNMCYDVKYAYICKCLHGSYYFSYFNID